MLHNKKENCDKLVLRKSIHINGTTVITLFSYNSLKTFSTQISFK